MKLDLKDAKPEKKPWLSEKNRKARYAWAKNHRKWSGTDFDNVVWSDEYNVEVIIEKGPF